MNLNKEKFKAIDLADPFFDSLKADYVEFPAWFAKKGEDSAYVFRGAAGGIEGFLYLKREDEEIADVEPRLPARPRIKVGTLKINPHGTRLGERFLKKIFDHALAEGVEEIYVTAFEKHEALVALLQKYGFKVAASKNTQNGKELVLVKNVFCAEGGILERYPLVKLGGARAYLLSLYPTWHTRLLPDSILKGEDASIVQDVSHTNSIHKVYLAAMGGMEVLKPGDVLLVYRTTDGQGPAHFRSVATTLCVVEEYRNINSFGSENEFIRYCEPYSVFALGELKKFWRDKKYPHVIRFAYNYALPKRVTRGHMIERLGFDGSAYWGFMSLSEGQLRAVLSAGGIDEDLIVD